MGSIRWQVGRLGGGSCSNDDSSNVDVLTVARLGGELRKQSMQVRAGDGGWQTT
jgi:hypothetical protein